MWAAGCGVWARGQRTGQNVCSGGWWLAELGDSTVLIGSSHEPCKALSWVVIVAAAAPRATVPVEDRLATLGLACSGSS